MNLEYKKQKIISNLLNRLELLGFILLLLGIVISFIGIDENEKYFEEIFKTPITMITEFISESSNQKITIGILLSIMGTIFIIISIICTKKTG